MGQSPGFLLTGDGRTQAQLAGMALKDIKFDQIYAADLERAFETASIIVTNNLSASKASPEGIDSIIQGNKLLRERSFGILDLKEYEEYNAAAERVGLCDDTSSRSYKPEGGEDEFDVKKRAIEFLKYLSKTIANNAHLDPNFEIKKQNN